MLCKSPVYRHLKNGCPNQLNSHDLLVYKTTWVMGEEDQLIKAKRSQKLAKMKNEDKRSGGVLVRRIVIKKIHYCYQMMLI